MKTTGQAKLKVAGKAALRIDGIDKMEISGCKLENASGPPVIVQCKTVASATGEATKLKVSGKPVALDTLTGVGSGSTANVPEKLSVTVNQTKLKAS
ncbi:hypothetical protein OM076_11345 [Solirubrobacter ginsenosidimutans]|uniref:Uncharacterized protein n=1 Tax=Solirubrobacter ginsenosidimutans TaxID=490573 RepID=A0A9X3S259_9ACTN|nr:hypothetical protein [Solirubrobacter ginsenosidimutans]